MSPFAVGLRGLVHTYRVFVAPWLPPACRFTPSCSVYALEALKRHGAFHGGWLSVKRLARCQPWGAWGYDPVPDGPIHDPSHRGTPR